METLTYLETLVQSFRKGVKVSQNTSFEELNMDSYEIVDFLIEVEKEFNISIDDFEMLELKDMQDVITTINKCIQEEN